jgi:hypothetical protein
MSAIKLPSPSPHDELIMKLVRAGYLSSAKRHDPAAIARAITRLKDVMRGRPAEYDGPRAV